MLSQPGRKKNVKKKLDNCSQIFKEIGLKILSGLLICSVIQVMCKRNDFFFFCSESQLNHYCTRWTANLAIACNLRKMQTTSKILNRANLW